MTARLPYLLVLCCVGALPLVACKPHSEQSAARPTSIAAAQRSSLAGAVQSMPAVPVALNNDPAALAARAADEVHLPDGTVGVRVAKRYYHTIVVCRQADGSFSSDCAAAAAGARP